ncbi:MAG: hypothetical protein AB4040_14410 [Synechococcus sp.]
MKLRYRGTQFQTFSQAVTTESTDLIANFHGSSFPVQRAVHQISTPSFNPLFLGRKAY